MDAVEALRRATVLLERLRRRHSFVDRTDKYYGGDHPLKFASPEWTAFHQDRYKDFADNWCEPVVDATAERINLLGVNREDLNGLWTSWQRNDGEIRAIEGRTAYLTNSVSYVCVWDDGNNAGNPLLTWEHASQVWVERDPATRRVREAIKSWTDEDTQYLTFYTPDFIWKWERKTSEPTQTPNGVLVTADLFAGGGWFERAGDSVWPLPNPLGAVPVVPYEFKPRLKHGPASAISGVIPMQDAVNLLWSYLFSASDHASLPSRVVTGQAPPKMPILNEVGDVIGERTIDIQELAAGRMLWLNGENAKIDQWDAAKLDVFTDVIEIAVGHIAAQTRTPPHYLNSKGGLSNLSGDALTAAETGLVQKVKRQTKVEASATAEVFRLMALVRGEDALAETITPGDFEYENPVMQTEAQKADALQKKTALGYPLEYIMELDGVSPDDRQRILEMRDRDVLNLDGVYGVPPESPTGDD